MTGRAPTNAGPSFGALHARRFAQIPLFCGNDECPGTDEVEEWRAWDAQATTPDQLRIEEHLAGRDLRALALLHVGVGNSSLAERFRDRIRSIVGTSISDDEVALGNGLGYPNYAVFMHNKYSAVPLPTSHDFDVIVDNNPTSFGCCWTHFEQMMRSYEGRLTAGGLILTDRVGLGWVVSTPGANRRWSFSFDDWAAAGQMLGLRAVRLTDDVYALRRPPVDRRPWWARGARRISCKLRGLRRGVR